MRETWLLPVVLAFAPTSRADPPAKDSRPSRDGRWIIAWSCKRTWQPDSCSILFSRRLDGKVFFTHQTNDRYIQAVWSSDSSKCILLDAPDNANSYLWLFRVKGCEVTTEKLDYDNISAHVEAAVPAARPRDMPGFNTRSGIENIDWLSSAQVRLFIRYNNIPVLVTLDVSKPHAPAIRVLPNET